MMPVTVINFPGNWTCGVIIAHHAMSSKPSGQMNGPDPVFKPHWSTICMPLKQMPSPQANIPIVVHYACMPPIDGGLLYLHAHHLCPILWNLPHASHNIVSCIINQQEIPHVILIRNFNDMLFAIVTTPGKKMKADCLPHSSTVA